MISRTRLTSTRSSPSGTTRSSRVSGGCPSRSWPRSTARRRDRPVPRAGLRPGRGGRVGVLPAGLRQHRAGARRRLVAAGAVPDRASPGRPSWRMLGERLGARQALDWGLINKVWPDGEFAEESAKLLDRLAGGATKSYAGTKRQLNRWLSSRWTPSSSSRHRSSGRCPAPSTSPRESGPSPRSGRPGSPARSSARSWTGRSSSGSTGPKRPGSPPPWPRGPGTSAWPPTRYRTRSSRPSSTGGTARRPTRAAGWPPRPGARRSTGSAGTGPGRRSWPCWPRRKPGLAPTRDTRLTPATELTRTKPTTSCSA